MTGQINLQRRLSDSRATFTDMVEAMQPTRLGDKPFEVNRQLECARHNLDRITAWAEHVTRDASAADRSRQDNDLDDLISFLEREEGCFMQEFAPKIQTARKALKQAVDLPADATETATRQLDLFEELVTRHEEVLRDLRWELMTIRAERARSDTGPVFDDPRDLERYLDRLQG